MRKGRHDAQHATEAVEERNGQRHAVVGSELLAFADVEAVVQDVAVREHDALREARGAGRVLHHHHVVVVEMGFRLCQRLFGHMASQQHELRHAIAAAMLFGTHVDDVLEEGVVLGLQVAALLRERLGHEISDDLQIVHVAIGVDDAQRLHVRLLQHVVKLVALVHGVHRDHDHADLGRGVHERQPVGDVARPHAEVVAWAHADGEQAARQVVGALVELLVRPTQRAVGIHDELVIGIYSHLIAEVATDGLLGVQRVV